MRVATLLLGLFAASAALGQATGRVEGVVTVKKDGEPKDDRSNVVVYLEGLPPPKQPNAPKVIRQKDLQFEPQLTVLVKGDSLEFPNEDKVFHNVFSVSEPARFDLGLYKSGTSKTVTFKRPGTVDIYCNIHPQMVAKVKVVENAFYAVTGKDGRFRIDGVPSGTWTLVAWQPYGAEWRTQVTVAPGAPASVNVELVEGSKPKWHLRKDGTPYGRYK